MYKLFLDESFFEGMVEMVSKHLGHDCEVVLHDFSKGPDASIIKIYNGHVTGRDIGGPATNFGLKALKSKHDFQDRTNYITQLNDGRLLRSSTLHVRDEGGKAKGAICINQDITELVAAQRTIKKNAGFSFELEQTDPTKEIFVTNVGDLLDHFIAEYQNLVEIPVANMTREDKIQAVKFFDDRGAFLISRAGDRINNFLNISKYTLYQYLDIARTSGEKE